MCLLFFHVGSSCEHFGSVIESFICRCTGHTRLSICCLLLIPFFVWHYSSYPSISFIFSFLLLVEREEGCRFHHFRHSKIILYKQ